MVWCGVQGVSSICVLILCVVYIYAVFGVIAFSSIHIFPGKPTAATLHHNISYTLLDWSTNGQIILLCLNMLQSAWIYPDSS